MNEDLRSVMVGLAPLCIIAAVALALTVLRRLTRHEPTDATGWLIFCCSASRCSVCTSPRSSSLASMSERLGDVLSGTPG